MNNKTKSDVVEELKRLPPLTQQVCGNCRFYQRNPSYPEWGACHAVGGLKAHDVWPKCQGRWWQQRISFRQRLRNWWSK
jgi:High potential iron-sulfur protein